MSNGMGEKCLWDLSMLLKLIYFTFCSALFLFICPSSFFSVSCLALPFSIILFLSILVSPFSFLRSPLPFHFLLSSIFPLYNQSFSPLVFLVFFPFLLLSPFPFPSFVTFRPQDDGKFIITHYCIND